MNQTIPKPKLRRYNVPGTSKPWIAEGMGVVGFGATAEEAYAEFCAECAHRIRGAEARARREKVSP